MPLFWIWGIALNSLACFLISPPKKRFDFFQCYQSAPYLSLFVSILSVVIFGLLFSLIAPTYWLAYFILISALIITIRTDAEAMLISRFASLFLVPFGFLLSYLNKTQLTLTESAIGATAGYLILYIIHKVFYWIRKKEGIGQGDFELLALIGAFLGPIGCWASLLLGSFIGSFVGLFYAIQQKKLSSIKLPFGPFLAFGALAYIFLQQQIIWLFL